MNCRGDQAIKNTLTFEWPLLRGKNIQMQIVYRLPWALCSEMISSNPNKVVEALSKSPRATHYLSDKPRLLPLSFSLCCCCYHNHSATSSFKCEGLMFFSIHLLAALKSLSTISCLGFLFFFYSVSENACGLKLFKCSLPRTSCLITYLLDLLSHIFSLKDKLKEKCRLSSSQRELGDLKEFNKTLVLINNSHLIACILVKSVEDTEVDMKMTILKASNSYGRDNDSSLKMEEMKIH